MGVANVETACAEIAESLQEAALGFGSWDDALRQLAAATGSKSGQLIGIGPWGFNRITEVDPSVMEAFERIGGHDPRINSRVRVGLRIPELKVVDETGLDTRGDAERTPEWGDLLWRQAGIPNICLTNLIRQDDILVGLAVNRSETEGNIDAEQRRLFEAVAPHARNAVRLHLAMEMRGMGMVAEAMEQLSIAAFVHDRTGRVQAMSPVAEGVIGLEGPLALRGGRLVAIRECEDVALQAAIATAIGVEGVLDAVPHSVVVSDGMGMPLMLEVSAMPRRHGFPFDAGVLIVARMPRDIQVRATDTARMLFGLTRAEAVVAGMMVAGIGPQGIADRTGTALPTVRTHIKRAYEKAGLNSSVEFVAAVTSRL